MKLSYIIPVILLLSCGHNEGGQKQDFANNDANIQRKNLDCMPNDTMINKNRVRYIGGDSTFSVKITIDEHDSILPHRFSCSVPPDLFPTLYAEAKGVICLRRSSGRDFIEFIICYVDNSKMFLRTFEIALAIDLKNDNVIYQNYDSLEYVIVENYKTGYQQIVKIPPEIISPRVYDAGIKNNSLTLLFFDDKKLTVPYINGNIKR